MTAIVDPEEPWDCWVPGVLSARQVNILIEKGYIKTNGNSNAGIDHSSIDLTLGGEIYELPNGSVKPFGKRYLHEICAQKLAKKLEDESGEFTLQKRTTYVAKIQENISHLAATPIFGQATAKSTIGRMDVLARLIVDGMQTYEEFNPSKIGDGDMYLEITPMTFNVKVRRGISLTQLRFFKGPPSECEISGKYFFQTVIRNDKNNYDGSLSLDTSPVKVAGQDASAFMSNPKDENVAIQLWGKAHTDPWKHWDIVPCDGNNRICIEPGRFYIMRSSEKIAVPKGVAVYCRAIDETIGEMRIHYAGFAHPFFGYADEESPAGTPLVFEVRGHDVRVSLGNREKMAKLVFYRMSEDASVDNVDFKDVYQRQTLQLSKIFKEWD